MTSETTPAIPTLTRTQLQFFQAFAEKSVRASYATVAEPEIVEAFISQIDFKEFGKRFGQAMLAHVSYSDVKAVDKFMQSEQFNNVMNALEEAVDSVSLAQSDAENIALTTSFVLDTVSPVLAPEEYAEALVATNKPLTPLEQLLMRAKG